MKKLITIAFLCILCVACSKIFNSGPLDEDVLAGSVEGLSPQQELAHLQGDENFARIFGKNDGLGPIFVEASCEACHVGDGKGHPFTTLTRFNKITNGNLDQLKSEGGPQLQERAIGGYQGEIIPNSATGFTRLTPPAVTGLGFIEAISDADILAHADPLDTDNDGISGRAQWVDPPSFFKPKPRHISNNGKFLARFGKKCGAIDLAHQTANAYLQDMGITTPGLLEDLYNHKIGPGTGDNVADPEVVKGEFDATVFYLQTLKAPPRRDTDDEKVKRGESVFQSIGCQKCHIAEFTTGDHEIEALANKKIYPFSDFLLHDMGPGLDDGYSDQGEETFEWRTPPLWGLGLSEDSQGGGFFLMHDGRARNIQEAIKLHGGEGQMSAEAFMALDETSKNDILQFLLSL